MKNLSLSTAFDDFLTLCSGLGWSSEKSEYTLACVIAATTKIIKEAYLNGEK